MISHPEKVLFPEAAITKGELAAYYEAVAPAMARHLAGRPLTMERFPAGIDKKGFIQKDLKAGTPDWLGRVRVDKHGHAVTYPVVDDARGLAWLANQNCITPHVWSARLPDLEAPDLCVFDLDPSQDDPGALRAAALCVRDVLAELGLASWPKTSGSKGHHIVIPLDGRSDFEAVWRFALGVGRLLVKREPALFTQEFLKVERGERILIDTARNAHGATFAAAYAVRARAAAPVSAPCTWAELERGEVEPQSFDLRSMPARLATTDDLWATLYDAPQGLAAATARLHAQLTPADFLEAEQAVTRRSKPRKR
jgi:bifunctional non-homologous end joining protein LigD